MEGGNQNPLQQNPTQVNPASPAPTPVGQSQPNTLRPTTPVAPVTSAQSFNQGVRAEYRPQGIPVQPVRTSRSGSGAAVALSLIALIVGVGSLLFGLYLYSKSLTGASTSTPSNNTYLGNTIEFEQTSIASIVTKVSPAVVSIVSESYVEGYSYWSTGSTVQSAGTGMIVTEDGYIVTNKHVIDGSRNIQVITDAGDTFDNVNIVGVDPLNDVAYLKINDAHDLPTVNLGDSKSIMVGQPVLAIGNALGAYQNSVTQGIIGGSGRSIAAGDSDGNNVEYLTDMIQTDAAINPGNSGGPLVNAAGDVIGINTATATDAQGLGFAIPISATKGMLNNIIDNGKAERAYLGLTYVTITPEVARTYGLDVTSGAYVYNSESTRSSAVVSGGPADKAGIKDRDIIISIAGVDLGSSGSISSIVGEFKPDDVVDVVVIRDGQTQTIQVTLGAYK